MRLTCHEKQYAAVRLYNGGVRFRSAVLIFFVILFSISTVGTAKAQDAVCAKGWSLQSWWDAPAIFKYSPVFGNTVGAQFKSKMTYGLFAPQLSNEARELIRKQGKDITVQFLYPARMI